MAEDNGESSNNDDWVVECSDDELAGVGDDWQPPPAELENLYEEICKNGIIHLEWKCPGRRPPSPIGNEEPSDNTNEELK